MIRNRYYTSKGLEEDHYYPFGLTISEDAATGAAPNNIKYNSKELQGEFDLQYYDYGARMYNSQIGQWNGIDQMAEKFYSESPVVYAGNNPVKNIDVGGKCKLDAKVRQYAPILSAYLDNNVSSDVSKSPTIINGFMKYGQANYSTIQNTISKNAGPVIEIVEKLPNGASGYYTGGKNGHIQIAQDMIDILKSSKTPEDKQTALLNIVSTVFHETVHYMDGQDGTSDDNQSVTMRQVPTSDGPVEVPRFLKNEGPGDKGHYFETDVYNGGNDEKGPIDNIQDAQKVRDRQVLTNDKEHILPTLP